MGETMTKKLNDMTSEELQAHFAYINSPEFEAAFEAQLEREEQMRKSVTDEEGAGRYMPPIVLDPKGVPRFRENVIATGLLKSSRTRWGDPDDPELVAEFKMLERENAAVQWLLRPENAGLRDMNDIAVQGFPQKDLELFAMIIGYSVSGAGDLSYFSDAMWERAWKEAERLLKEAARQEVEGG